MTNLTPPEEMAATLVQMEYPRDEIREALVKRYPDINVDELIDAAQQRKDTLDTDLADAQAANEHTADG